MNVDLYIPSDFDKSDALALEHLDLVDKSQAVLRLGKMLLACGAGAYRVKSTMARAAKAIGIDRHESQVSLMEITATAWQGHNFRTETVEIRTVGVNVAKLDMIMVACSRFHDNMDVVEINQIMDDIDHTAPTYNVWSTVLASAVACAGFAFLNNGRWVECLSVFVAAGVGQIIRKILLKRRVTHFAVWTACAAISTLIYIVLVTGGMHLHIFGAGHATGVVSAILYIVPGFPMTTAILDFVRMDFWSALTRINYCLMVLGSAGVSVYAVVHLLKWPTVGELPAGLDIWTLNSIRVICSFIAAYGFAVLFNATWKVCLVAGFIGAFANTGRLILQGEPVILPWQMAVGLAAFVVGVCATICSWHSSHSRVSLSVPAVVIMIPGVPFYKALVAINEGELYSAMGPIFEVFFVVMAIGFGIAMSRILLDKGWIYDSDTNVLPLDLQKTSKDVYV